MRDLIDPHDLPEYNVLNQLFTICIKLLILTVGREGFDYQIDRAFQSGKASAIYAGDIAQFSPVVFSARKTFFLNSPDNATVLHEAYAAVLSAVDP